jgi:cell wall-associated NlpC family hydrolase
MQRKLPILFIAIAFTLLLPTIAQAATLRTGSSGPAVVTLQSELNIDGYAVGATDGVFGLITAQGVIRFQAAEGLTADGIVGPATEAALQPKSRIETKTDAIIATAKEYLGTPYRWGGTTPAGFDCSGFVQYVFAHNGITLQRVSVDQSKNGNEVAYSNLLPGDLMFFSMSENGIVSHVGIYIGNGQFIGSENAGVRIVTLDQYWAARFVIARGVY